MESVFRVVLSPISKLYSKILGLASSEDVFFETRDVPWIQALEENWETIRGEYLAFRQKHALPVLTDVLSGEAKIGGDKWKTLILVFFGTWIEENCREMPVTTSLLRQVPGMTSAMVSILEPGQVLTPHYGMYRGVLRYHLALEVPEPIESCGIQVDGIVRHWKPGESLLFDDTFLHDVWNRGTSPRAVLFLDVKRTLLPPVSWMNDIVTFIICRILMPRMARISGAAPKPLAPVADHAVGS